MGLKKVVVSLKRHKSFLVTTHVNSEGDALGSELALHRLLLALGKRVTIVNEDDLPCEYGFLPGADKIIKYTDRLGPIAHDCFVALDCSDPGRCGEVFKLRGEGVPVVNIDHHLSNSNFGKINWVDAKASSTAEMVYRIFKQMRLALDADAALALYVGILTDTGSFRYPNTTGFTHQAIAEIMKYGLDVSGIYKKIYENVPYEDMKLIAQILPGMKQACAGKVVWFQIEQRTLKKGNLSIDLSEQILKFARAIRGVEVAVLFKENIGAQRQIRVNLRSQGKVDVNRIARFFGGGGHKTASGCTINGKLKDVSRKVLAKICSSLK